MGNPYRRYWPGMPSCALLKTRNKRFAFGLLELHLVDIIAVRQIGWDLQLGSIASPLFQGESPRLRALGMRWVGREPDAHKAS
jgi:hypothetical protein